MSLTLSDTSVQIPRSSCPPTPQALPIPPGKEGLLSSCIPGILESLLFMVVSFFQHLHLEIDIPSHCHSECP